MKHLYLSGPMSNLPNLNFPAFHSMVARLRAASQQIINPQKSIFLQKNNSSLINLCFAMPIKPHPKHRVRTLKEKLIPNHLPNNICNYHTNKCVTPWKKARRC